MFKTAEIISNLEAKIKSYDDKLDQQEVGKVLTVGDGVVIASGLDAAFNYELVEFESGVQGMVLNLSDDSVGIVLLGDETSIIQGESVKRTGNIISVPVGKELIGRVVNPLGQPVDGKGPINANRTLPVERPAYGVMDRKSVTQPLETGIKAIDSVVPIGKGQRELIIGDRKTGKTQIAIDTILNQKGKNVYCVYVAIGQKQSTVSNITRKLAEAGALEYTTIVLSGAADLAPLQYIAPYSGVTIAEALMENGEDVLIVYDDLTKHASSYRTLSLLLRRPPGREAFPGDVFYLHSRLLERSAKLNDKLGGGSITALPIIETQAGDISAYIPTNVISITDGQIFLQSDLFNQGQRPAIDPGLSVSRVGGAAQHEIIKKLSGSIKIELAQYRELEAFTKFGSELDSATKRTLDHGARLMEVLKQGANKPLSIAQESAILFAVKSGYLKDVDVDKVSQFENNLSNLLNTEFQELSDEINTNGKFTPEVEKQLDLLMQKVK